MNNWNVNPMHLGSERMPMVEVEGRTLREDEPYTLAFPADEAPALAEAILRAGREATEDQ